MLSLVQGEVETPVSYYAVDKICDKLNLPVPSLKKVMGTIREAGFKAVPTHFNSRGFRTDASADVVRVVVTKLVA
jgi:tRNA G26 N,N-dimethylase Trm1